MEWESFITVSHPFLSLLILSHRLCAFHHYSTTQSQTSDGEPVFLKASFLAWVLANLEEGRGFRLSTRSIFKEWETSDCVLVIDLLALLFNIGQN